MRSYHYFCCSDNLGIIYDDIYLISSVWADSINPSLYSKDDKPYGQWTANFWKWMISIPQQNNPNNDPTGAKCAINQKDPMFGIWHQRFEVPLSALAQSQKEKPFYSHCWLQSAVMRKIHP